MPAKQGLFQHLRRAPSCYIIVIPENKNLRTGVAGQEMKETLHKTRKESEQTGPLASKRRCWEWNPQLPIDSIKMIDEQKK